MSWRRAPPCTRRPLLKKGSIRKLFCGRATYFLWKGKESGMPEPLIFGNWSMDTGRRPLCGCFVLSCMVGGIFRKPLGFRRCLPPARTEKALPFQAGQGPCTKHRQTVRLCLYAPKKVFGVPRGVFSKTLLGREWDSVPQRESEPAIGVCLFREGVKRNDGYGVQIFAFFRSFPERFGRGCRYGRRPRFPYQ